MENIKLNPDFGRRFPDGDVFWNHSENGWVGREWDEDSVMVPKKLQRLQGHPCAPLRRLATVSLWMGNTELVAQSVTRVVYAMDNLSVVEALREISEIFTDLERTEFCQFLGAAMTDEERAVFIPALEAFTRHLLDAHRDVSDGR